MLNSRIWCSYKTLPVFFNQIHLFLAHCNPHSTTPELHLEASRERFLIGSCYVSFLHISFYKELGLPDGREAAMERGDGSPTLNVIKGWISLEGRNATVQALISAVSRSKRKDCSYLLEKSLGCQLDCVDSPVENVTKKMSSLSKYSESTGSTTLTGTISTQWLAPSETVYT